MKTWKRLTDSKSTRIRWTSVVFLIGSLFGNVNGRQGGHAVAACPATYINGGAKPGTQSRRALDQIEPVQTLAALARREKVTLGGIHSSRWLHGGRLRAGPLLTVASSWCPDEASDSLPEWARTGNFNKSRSELSLTIYKNNSSLEPQGKEANCKRRSQWRDQNCDIAPFSYILTLVTRTQYNFTSTEVQWACSC
jgi:hypothetical protein